MEMLIARQETHELLDRYRSDLPAQAFERQAMNAR
jgi:hypothetical protein